MNIVLFDTEITGHHSEYISHIIDYLLEKPASENYYFVVHPSFPDRFRNITLKTKNNPNIHWQTVTIEEVNELSKLSIFKKSFAEYNLLKTYMNRLKGDMVYLMHFNIFQLALTLKRPSFKVRGILFNQFLRMTPRTKSEKLKYLRKYIVTKLLCLNSNIEKVFILNDETTVKKLNQKFNTKTFNVLPDPVPHLLPLKDFNIYKQYNIAENRKIFLHFGSLAERKGTIEFIESAAFVPKKIQKNIAFLIVGRPENQSTGKLINERISKYKKVSDVDIILDNGFVANETMKSLFDQCDVVVMPYKNVESSSGIFGHAVAARKPIITTGKGLLKELIENNGFGLLIEAVEPNLIAKTLICIGNLETKNSQYKEYLQNHTPEKFSKTLLE